MRRVQSKTIFSFLAKGVALVRGTPRVFPTGNVVWALLMQQKKEYNNKCVLCMRKVRCKSIFSFLDKKMVHYG